VALIEQKEADDKIQAIIEDVKLNHGAKSDLELAFESF